MIEGREGVRWGFLSISDNKKKIGSWFICGNSVNFLVRSVWYIPSRRRVLLTAKLLSWRKSPGSSSVSFTCPSNKDWISAWIECQGVNSFPSVRVVQTEGDGLKGHKPDKAAQSLSLETIWAHTLEAGSRSKCSFQRAHSFSLSAMLFNTSGW